MKIGLQRFLFMAITLLVGNETLAKPFPTEIIERFGDARIIVYTQQSAIDEAPAWKPTEGAPPLTIEALIKTVENWRTAHPELTRATIRKIELKPIAHNENRKRWYYLVQLKVEEQDRSTMHYLAVLMNGKILPAIREPEPYK
jgi:hypothetical protein